MKIWKKTTIEEYEYWEWAETDKLSWVQFENSYYRIQMFAKETHQPECLYNFDALFFGYA